MGVGIRDLFTALGVARTATLAVAGGVALLLAASLVIDPGSFANAVQATDIVPALLVALAELALAGLLLLAPHRFRGFPLAALLVVTVAGGVKIGAAVAARHATLESVRGPIEWLLSRPNVPADAQFYVVDQAVEPGTALEVRPLVGPTVSMHTVVRARFVMVDLAPGQLLGHPILYALASTEARPFVSPIQETVEAEWFATIGSVRRWAISDGFEVRGHPVALLAPSEVGARDGGPSWEPSVAAFLRDLGRGSVAAAAGKKRAVVVDGGGDWVDTSNLPNTFLLNRLAEIEVRRKIRDQAEELGDRIKDYGYGVTRLSGLGFDPAPAPTLDRLKSAISEAARDVGPGGELYLHFIAHGSTNGLALYDKDFVKHPLSYQDLAGILGGLDPSIRKVVAIDACHSGAAAQWLDGIKGIDLHAATTEDGITSAGTNSKRPSYTQSELARMRDSANALTDDPLEGALESADAAHAANGAARTLPTDAGPPLPQPVPAPPPVVAVPPVPIVAPPVPPPVPQLVTPQLFQVAGTLVDSVTNLPVAGAQVFAYRLSSSATEAIGTTDGSGRFSLTLPADGYRLRLASPTGAFQTQDWSGTLTVNGDRSGVVVRVLRPSR